MLQERTKRWLRRLALVGFAVSLYVAAVIATFPYGRLRERIEELVQQNGYHLTIGSLGPAFPVGVVAEDVVAREQPHGVVDRSAPKPAPVVPIVIDRVRARIGLLALLVGTMSLDLDASLGGGRIALEVVQRSQSLRLTGAIESVAVRELPGVAQSLPLPVAGTLDSKIDLTIPTKTVKGKKSSRVVYKPSELDGSIELDCRDCAVGDGKAKLTVPGDPFLQAGLTVPRIRIGTLSGSIVIEHGVARFRSVESKSPDGELSLSGTVTLRDALPLSTARLYATFRLSEELKQREATIGLLTQGLPAAAKRSDGSSGFQIIGVLSRPTFLPSKTAPSGG